MKTGRRVTLAISAAAISAGIVAAQGMHKGAMTPAYDPAKETSIQGTVDRVTTGRMMGVHLVVKTAEKTVTVMVGPQWFLNDKKFSFAKGEELKVTGSPVQMNNAEALIAREIKKGDAVLVLRNKQGIPEWAGRGRMRNATP